MGVDVFFVISGYLISGIIFRGISAGNFSFLEFYSKRIKRIIPNLIAVLFLLFVLGGLFYLQMSMSSLLNMWLEVHFSL